MDKDVPAAKKESSSNTIGKDSASSASSASIKVEKSKDAKELKREEKLRDKEEAADLRKREREKRRERKTASPSTYYDVASNDRYYVGNDQYEPEIRERDRADRERERDFSSISNSSNGSTIRRSHESPDIERGNNILTYNFFQFVF